MTIIPQKVTIADEVLVQDLDNTTIVLNLVTEHYYGLDEVGRRLWQLLSELKDVQQVYDIMIEEYDVEPNLLQKDMIRLLNALSEAKLISVA